MFGITAGAELADAGIVNWNEEEEEVVVGEVEEVRA